MIRLNRHGFGTLEAMVAIGILTVVATSLAHALAGATRAHALSTRTMRATEKGMSVVERLRSGDFAIPSGEDGLQCEWDILSLPEPPGLSHFTVTVKWEQGGPQQVRLEGLSWQRP